MRRNDRAAIMPDSRSEHSAYTIPTFYTTRIPRGGGREGYQGCSGIIRSHCPTNTDQRARKYISGECSGKFYDAPGILSPDKMEAR